MHRHVRSVALLLALAACGPGGAPDLSAAAAAETAAGATLGAIALEGAKIPARGTFRVTVTDADPNLDASSLDGVVVHVSVAHPNASAGPSTPALLVETGPSTGVFTADVPIPAGVQDGDVVGVEYRDPNTGLCTPGSVRASATVDADSANLFFVPEAFSIPDEIVPGVPFQVNGTVENDSRGVAVPQTALCASLSRNAWDSEGYDYVEIVAQWNVTVPPLDAGGKFPFSLPGKLALNSNTTPLTLELRADCGNAVPEWNEGDDLYRRTVGIDGPDLVVDQAVVTVPPDAVISGQSLDVTATVRNIGGGATSVETSARLRIHRQGWDYEGYEIDESYEIATSPVPILAAGASQVIPFHGVVPAGLNGVFMIEVIVDSPPRVAENNELNNFTPAPQPTIFVKGADLTVEITPETPTSIVSGQPLVVKGIVRNGSNVARAGASTVSVRFHRQGWDYEGYEIDESYTVGTAAIPALEPDESFPFTVTGTNQVQENLAGAFTLEVMADSGRVVVETDERNNWAAQPLTAVGADLTVAPEGTVPTSALGDGTTPYTIQVTVRNADGAAPAIASQVRALLTRKTHDPDGYDMDEVYVLTPTDVPRLAPGESWTGPISGTIPTTATRATYTLVVNADSTWRVAESNESNNAWSGTQVTVY